MDRPERTKTDGANSQSKSNFWSTFYSKIILSFWQLHILDNWMLIAARVIFVRHQLIPPLHLCFSSKFCGIYLQLASMTAITMSGFFIICQKIIGHFCLLKIRQSIIYYAGLLRWWYKWIVDQASDVPSIIIFFMISCKILCKNPFNSFSYFFIKLQK